MYSVLCYGDSNTWGFVPGSGGRYPLEVRWTGVLQRELGDRYRVIEEGLNARTTVWEDPILPGRNGKEYLLPCLETHRPLDAVVLCLGINDLKKRYAASTVDVAKGVGVLIAMIDNKAFGPEGRPPKLLVVTPPLVGKLTEYAEMFEGAAEKSPRLAGRIREVAEAAGCEFLDIGEVARTSDGDGIHLEPEAHQALGRAVARKVAAMLP
jgi:lysophospholipase L1-like esterase